MSSSKRRRGGSSSTTGIRSGSAKRTPSKGLEKISGKASRRLSEKISEKPSDLIFVPTWHPAYLFKDMARGARSFLLHVKKAVDAALGKPEDPLPRILKDPEPEEAKKIFKSWTGGFAVDVETPGLRDFQLLSIAVCGQQDLAMVWSLPSRRLGPLREALASKTRKVVQNGDFDIGVLQTCGFDLDPETFWDTMIEAQILHPDEPVNLSFLASMAVDTRPWKHMRDQDLLTYNAIDAWADWMIYLDNQRGYDEEES